MKANVHHVLLHNHPTARASILDPRSLPGGLVLSPRRSGSSHKSPPSPLWQLKALRTLAVKQWLVLAGTDTGNPAGWGPDPLRFEVGCQVGEKIKGIREGREVCSWNYLGGPAPKRGHRDL